MLHPLLVLYNIFLKNKSYNVVTENKKSLVIVPLDKNKSHYLNERVPAKNIIS